jgi:hypothetical protein
MTIERLTTGDFIGRLLFDPVPIEVVAGFRMLCAFEFAQMLGLAVGKSVGLGMLIALPPLGSLAGCSKIDKFSHSTARR